MSSPVGLRCPACAHDLVHHGRYRPIGAHLRQRAAYVLSIPSPSPTSCSRAVHVAFCRLWAPGPLPPPVPYQHIDLVATCKVCLMLICLVLICSLLVAHIHRLHHRYAHCRGRFVSATDAISSARPSRSSRLQARVGARATLLAREPLRFRVY